MSRSSGQASSGWSEIGGKRYYFRSLWERNYAHYLEWLKLRGLIKDWSFESHTFWFDKIKRGVRSYLPDFLVIECSGSETWHEVKGWMDSKSATKIKRMAKYYPDVKLIVIDKKQYSLIAKYAALIPGWERDVKSLPSII